MREGWHVRVLALIGLIGLIIAALVAVGQQQPVREREPTGGARSPSAPRSSASKPTEWHWPRLGEDGRARIRGRIVEPDTGPLAEGRVDLHCPGAVYLISTAVGDDGEFEAPACAEAPTCVRLVHPGVEQPRAWELEAGPEVEIELEVQAAPTVVGVIVGPDHEVVPGAELFVRRGATQLALGSDAAGEFFAAFVRERPCDRCDLDDSGCRREPSTLEADRVHVFASAPNYAAVEVEIGFGLGFDGEPVEIMLAPPAPALIGRVIGAEGEPFAGRTRVIASHHARDHERHAAGVDAEGRFSFESLAEAEYSLRVLRDDRELASLAVARPGEEVELRSSSPARGSTLTLEITDAEGEPIAGVRVDGGPWRAAISDAAGRVEAEAVLPGTYTVRVRGEDSEPQRETMHLEPGTSAWFRRVQLR